MCVKSRPKYYLSEKIKHFWTKDLLFSRCSAFPQPHDERNLRSTLLIWHCHQSINTSSMNDRLCCKLFVKHKDNGWIPTDLWPDRSNDANLPLSEFTEWGSCWQPFVFSLVWHSQQIWVSVESMILHGRSASCFDSLYVTWVFFGERLFGSSASKSICLVGSQISLWLDSFIGLLFGCCNWIKCICMTCQKKDCQWHQELQKSRHCIQSFPFHCFNWCPVNNLKHRQFCLCN